MNILWFILLCGIVSAKNIPRYTPDNAAEHFDTFIRTYNKECDKEEKTLRYEIFLKNLEEINILNEKSNDAEYGITQFSDLSVEEFLIKHTGYKRSKDSHCDISSDETEFGKDAKAPDAFDWRTKGVVTPVKNQQQCGSCWAFSVTGNLESVYTIKTKKLMSLSEQQLMDCDVQSFGCNGGSPMNAIQYLESKGAMTEADYPYEARDAPCRYNGTEVHVNVTGCKAINVQEEQLTQKLYNIGPLSIAIDARQLQHYKSGIIIDDQCNGILLDHAVLLVGYGKSKDGKSYWIVKNSWGTNWGEQGYFRMQRGVSCLMFIKCL